MPDCCQQAIQYRNDALSNRTLYTLEQKVSARFKAADSISHSQYVFADSAYRYQVGLSGELLTRAEAAEQKLKTAQAAIDAENGRTWAGKQLRRARNGLAGVGAGAIIVTALKLLL